MYSRSKRVSKKELLRAVSLSLGNDRELWDTLLPDLCHAVKSIDGHFSLGVISLQEELSVTLNSLIT